MHADFNTLVLNEKIIFITIFLIMIDVHFSFTNVYKDTRLNSIEIGNNSVKPFYESFARWDTHPFHAIL